MSRENSHAATLNRIMFIRIFDEVDAFLAAAGCPLTERQRAALVSARDEIEGAA